MKKILITIAVLVAIFAIAVLIVARTFYPDNVAETAPDGGAKDLKSRVYKTDLANAATVAAEVIPTLSTWGSNWKVAHKSVDADSGVIHAEVPVLCFTDDLEVKITASERENAVSVNVRSASRVGKSDFGENRRHVVQLLDALDQKFSQVDQD